MKHLSNLGLPVTYPFLLILVILKLLLKFYRFFWFSLSLYLHWILNYSSRFSFVSGHGPSYQFKSWLGKYIIQIYWISSQTMEMFSWLVTRMTIPQSLNIINKIKHPKLSFIIRCPPRKSHFVAYFSNSVKKVTNSKI